MRKRLLLLLFFIGFVCIPSFGQTKRMEQMIDEAKKAEKKGQHNRADSIYREYIVAFKANGLTKNFEYSELLSNLAQRLALRGQVDEAIKMQEEVIEVRKTALDCTYAQWAASTCDLASLYARKGNYNKAIEIGEQGLEMLRKKYGEGHHYCCIALASLANYYSARGLAGDSQKAVELCEKALEKMKTGTPAYASALNSLVFFYSQTGNLIQANKLTKKALKEAKKLQKKDPINGAIVLNNNAIRLAAIGNYEQALDYMLTAKGFYDEAGSTQTLSYSKILTNLGTYYHHLHRYQDAVVVLEQALPVLERLVGKESSDYIRCVSDLSSVYKELGNLEKADELAHESDQISRKLGSQDNVKYAKSLSKQAATFASNGNYQRAIEHERKVIEIYRNRKDSLSMAFAIGELANYLFANGNKEKALATMEQALDIYRNRGLQSPNYAQALNNSAILYYNAGNYQQASLYGQQSLDMYKQIGDTISAIYARILSNNALFHFVSNDRRNTIEIAQKAVSLHRSLLGESHPDNVPLLYNLAVYQMQSDMWQEAQKNYQQALKIQAEQVRTNFLHLTSQERESFWNQKKYVFGFAPLLAYQLNKNHIEGSETAISDAYNAILFTKGILLNSDIDFKNLLKRTGDKLLLDKYEKLEQLRQNERDYYKLNANQRVTFDIKKIQEEIYQLERSLVRGCKEYGNFTENLAITAEKISQSLNDDEAAIEFADIYLKGIGTTYLAFLLRKGDKTPKLIRLFSEEDLKDLKYGTKTFKEAMKDEKGVGLLYNDSVFGNRLWKPITSQLQGVKKIYFSPTGMFYQMGIEYLPCDANQRINDLYAVYRLSSTKSLIHPTKVEKISTATIYGGLNYDMSLTALRSQHDKCLDNESHAPLLAYTDTRSPGYVYGMQRTLDSLSIRGSVNFLEGTKYEALNINEQLLQNNVDTTYVLMGDEGIEETFKQLNGTSRSIIHIATHGFSFSEQEIKEKGDKLVFINEQNDNLDNMLNYSGLLMSGANYVLKGRKLPEDIEDGILTAREISQVDLGKVGLVVLSACQTALGEIREDGVFGIQRGFKKAGAHSLLMSLWKVDDRATEIMMTAFYRNLVKSNDRYDAFKKAQKTVRERGFKSPYYWASFILLDGK